MEIHKGATRELISSYKSKTLSLKRLWGDVNATNISTGSQNCMAFGSLSISATLSFNFQIQVKYNNLLKGGEANGVVVHTLFGIAGVPFFVCLPIKGEIVQLVFSGNGATPVAESSVLVNCMLGHSTAYKVIP